MNGAIIHPSFELDDERWFGLVRAAAEDADLGTLAGYTLVGPLGRGSQGVVYRARQPGTNREVAIKRIAHGSAGGRHARARMAREIEALSSLSHPGIVTVHTVEHEGGATLLVMELVDGLPIDRWATGVDTRARVQTFALLADAIAHAHRKGVIHRDLKPTNVLVTKDGVPRVLDFGLATLTNDHGQPLATTATTAAGSGFLGTPAYASPEQLENAPPDTRSDIFSLGAMLYQALTGTLPFDAQSLGSLFRSLSAGPPPAPSTANRAASNDLDAVTLTALAHNPVERYQTADALAADLRCWLAGDPVSARPPSRIDRAIRTIRRSPTASALIALSVAAVVVLAVAASVQTYRLSRRSAQLQREATNAAQTLETLRAMIDAAVNASANGHDQPVHAMIDTAVARLTASENGFEPAARFALWDEIAQAAFRAECLDQFEAIVLRVSPQVREFYGQGHPATASWLILQGLAREHRRDYPDAAELYGRALLALQSLPDPDAHPDTARAANNLGIVLVFLGRHEQAHDALLKTLQLRTAHHGTRHATVSTALRNLGSNERNRKNFALAHDYYKRALEALPEGVEPAARARMIIFHNQARLLRDEGRLQESHDLCEKSLAALAATRGPFTAQAGRFYGLKAQLYAMQGHVERALEACEARDKCDNRDAEGSRHKPDNDLERAGLLMRLGRWDQAREALLSAQQLAAVLDPPNPELAGAIQQALIHAQQRTLPSPPDVGGESSTPDNTTTP